MDYFYNPIIKNCKINKIGIEFKIIATLEIEKRFIPKQIIEIELSFTKDAFDEVLEELKKFREISLEEIMATYEILRFLKSAQ